MQKRMPGDEECPRQKEFHEKDVLKESQRFYSSPFPYLCLYLRPYLCLCPYLCRHRRGFPGQEDWMQEAPIPPRRCRRRDALRTCAFRVVPDPGWNRFCLSSRTLMSPFLE